jgi:hypothetical protein
MIRQDGESQYVDGETTGEALQPILNPLSAMFVVLAGVGIEAAQEAASDTAIDAMAGGDFERIEDLGAGHASHVRIPGTTVGCEFRQSGPINA